MKRLLDLCCIFAGIFIFGPPALLITIAILLDDGGPLFFRQNRLGKKGKIFEVLKFRTMRDGQVTRVGRILRPCGLDELPQLLSVLRGDMSIVGPRPLTESDVNRLGWAKHSDRWDVKPGLTGLAQIHVGRGARQSLYLDRAYAKRAGFWFDMRIILISLMMNFAGKRRVQNIVFRRRTQTGSRKVA